MKRSRGTVHRLLSLLSPLNKYGQQGNPETRSGASWIWKPSHQTKDLESIFFREYSLCCCLLDEESAAENWLGWVGRWVSGVDKWKSLFTRQVNFSNLQGWRRERKRKAESWKQFAAKWFQLSESWSWREGEDHVNDSKTAAPSLFISLKQNCTRSPENAWVGRGVAMTTAQFLARHCSHN